MRTVPFIILFFIFGVQTAICGDDEKKLESSFIPSLISCLQIDEPLDFCGEKIPLDNPEIREGLEKEILLTVWNRPQVILWLKRSGRHFPHVEQMLKKHAMPDDLKYVAVVESALRPHVRSSKGALGFWQFIKPTGRRYGLAINSDIDERRNIFASTEAAIKYFQKLYTDFESWTLAAAAYNMGEDGLKRRMAAQKTEDYYNTYLYLETQRYILKIIAVKMIFTDPEKYGFYLSDSDFYKPREFDRVVVNCPVETPIIVVAEAAGAYFKEIKNLNPEIRGHSLARGTHSVSVPKGAAKGFPKRYQERYKNWAGKKQPAKQGKRIVYVVKKGDSLSAIAERHRVSLSSLLRWNKRNIKRPIYPGEKLVIIK